MLIPNPTKHIMSSQSRRKRNRHPVQITTKTGFGLVDIRVGIELNCSKSSAVLCFADTFCYASQCADSDGMITAKSQWKMSSSDALMNCATKVLSKLVDGLGISHSMDSLTSCIVD